jgi:hypothetical protein
MNLRQRSQRSRRLCGSMLVQPRWPRVSSLTPIALAGVLPGLTGLDAPSTFPSATVPAGWATMAAAADPPVRTVGKHRSMLASNLGETGRLNSPG